MQPSASLADFLEKLEEGPQGAENAIAKLRECADEHAAILDLQQMTLTDEDMAEVADYFHLVADHVKSLNLFMNELTVLPASISTLSKLEVLEAGCNPLQTIEPDLFRGLPNLVELDIGFSETLEHLPDSFENSTALKAIHAGNGRLLEIPESLYKCQALSELHLYGNSLKALGEGIGNLSNLLLLNVGRNQLSELPSSIGSCSKLEVLHVYENCLSSVPVGVSKLEHLSTLNLASNINLPAPPREIRQMPGVRAVAEFYSTPAKC